MMQNKCVREKYEKNNQLMEEQWGNHGGFRDEDMKEVF